VSRALRDRDARSASAHSDAAVANCIIASDTRRAETSDSALTNAA